MSDDKRVYLFDSTLRDGAQTQGVDFSVADKFAIAQALDDLGLDYIEGGWPGANPTDNAFFQDPPTFKTARLVAFGMTRRAGRSTANDPGLAGLTNAAADSICMVGKSWDFHVDVALSISRDENLAMIADSVAHMCERKAEVMFDAEHFFDGYKADRDYALSCVTAAYEAGAVGSCFAIPMAARCRRRWSGSSARWPRSCPAAASAFTATTTRRMRWPTPLAAVRAGARQVQGTLNGLGERCGNANLVSLIPSLVLKTDYDVGIGEERAS